MAKTHAVRIETDGWDGRLDIDGTDLTDAVRGFTVSMSAGEIPTITLDLIVFDFEDDMSDARLIIPDKTRDALIALGWTPPEE